MKDLLFFSNNQNKILEINEIFKQNKIKIKNLNSLQKFQEPKETGKSFFENAKLKSNFGLKKFNLACFADDSGFCVEALKNKPGIKSKRFLESFKSKEAAFDYIISNVIKKNNNRAFFITVIALTLNTNHHIMFSGKVSGRVSLQPRGNNGFGFDPIFIPDNQTKTFAQMSSIEKNKISHRKKALEKMKSFLF